MRLLAPNGGSVPSTSFAELLSFLFCCLALGVPGGCLLQILVQLGLRAGRVLEKVSLQQTEVEHRVRTRRAAPRSFLDDTVPDFRRLFVILHAAVRDAERDPRREVVCTA